MSMSNKNKTPVIENSCYVMATVAVAGYRANFLELLVEHFGLQFHLLMGREDFDPSIASKIDLGPNMTVVRNRFFFNRNFVFQYGVIGPCVRAKAAVLLLNPRNVSVWIVLLTRKLLGRKTILWGHVWPRAGKDSRTDRVRGWMRGLADMILVYTDTEAANLAEIMPNKMVITLHNALYLKREMEPAHASRTPTNFVYVGRLVAEKKLDLLLDAYEILVESLPQAGDLVFIGSGPMQDDLMQRTAELGLSERVRFTGYIDDVSQLKEFYSQSIASVSPGSAGLSLTQSLGFGVPMIIADDEPHGPEIEAAREGENARFFTTGSVDSLVRELMRFSDEAQYWYERREAISKDCRDRYSSEAMAAAFIEAVTGRRSEVEAE